jgi:hypothetical protein
MTSKYTPIYTIVKSSGPRVLAIEELKEINEIGTDTVHAFPFLLKLRSALKLIVVQRKGSQQQQLGIHFWISKEPYGMTVLPQCKNLNVISITTNPTVVFIADKANKTPPIDPSLVQTSPGEYWANVQNRTGHSLFYSLVVEELS